MDYTLRIINGKLKLEPIICRQNNIFSGAKKVVKKMKEAKVE